MMKSILLLAIFLHITPQSALAGFGDDIAKNLFQTKVDQLHQKALLCDPLEKDPKSKMDVNDWMKIQPPLPDWQMLPGLETTATESKSYARARAKNDKIQHCLAGCYVAQKLDYKSAVLVGWMKELSDASDCSKSTAFEKKDYDATIKGAIGGRDGKDCEAFCKK